jgi:GT2 family glycosyltransferase
MRITAILTCHNRRAKTVACLRSYFEQEVPEGTELDAVLVDDGSSDGTAGEVRGLGKPVTIIEGAGDLFWAAGMATAESRALEGSPPDFLLWLNDDTSLDPDALERLLEVEQGFERPCLVVGAVRDPKDSEITYSGVRRHRIHPLRFDRVLPEQEPVEVDAFHGNLVLVPIASALAIGSIDGAFEHGTADYDYGLRAKSAGVINLLAPGTFGSCPYDHDFAPWLDPSLPLRERARLLLSRKGAPPRSRAHFLRRHGGPLWPIFWLGPYVRFALSIVHLGGRPKR